MHLIWALIDHYYTLIDYIRLPLSNIHNEKFLLLYLMVEICDVKGSNRLVKMHHIEKKDEKDTGTFRHIC
jgi:hypothetical protein